MMQHLFRAGREALWLLLLALALAAGAYALRPGVMAQNSSIGESGAGAQDSQISLEAAAEHFAQGTAVFADARPDLQFQAGHIQGALNLEPEAFDTWSEVVFEKIAADATIITYCDGPRCTLSLELGEKLTWLGYEKVLHLKNGWSAWKEKGLPTSDGPQ